ncbi:MAG: AAA family ATPase [Thermotogae bacterium]|nr:AAA family ATPase [Thermotogota bacterium]
MSKFTFDTYTPPYLLRETVTLHERSSSLTYHPLNRTLLGLLKLHKLGSLLSFVDRIEEKEGEIVLHCRNDILARMLQEKFADEIEDVESKLNLKVSFSYPRSAIKLFKESFDNFYYGKENEFTIAALRSIALGNGTLSSVLLVGSPGMGKTHLLKATANLSNFAGRKAVYLTAGRIVEKLISSYRNGDRPDFSNLKEASVILIDDIHVLKNRVFALEFLSRLIDRSSEKGKVIVMASEMEPAAFRRSSAFRSRLMSNVVLHIHPYPRNVRQLILQRRLDMQGVVLPSDYMDYVLDRVFNPRALIGVAVRVRAHFDIYSTVPDFSTFRSLIADLVEEEVDLLNLFGVKSLKKRSRELYLAAYAMKLIGMRASEIADALGCSRASVYNYIKRAKAILQNDPQTTREFNAKMKLLRKHLL